MAKNPEAPYINIQGRLSELCKRCPMIDLKVSILYQHNRIYDAVVICANEKLCSRMLEHLQSKEVTNK